MPDVAAALILDCRQHGHYDQIRETSVWLVIRPKLKTASRLSLQSVRLIQHGSVWIGASTQFQFSKPTHKHQVVPPLGTSAHRAVHKKRDVLRLYFGKPKES